MKLYSEADTAFDALGERKSVWLPLHCPMQNDSETFPGPLCGNWCPFFTVEKHSSGQDAVLFCNGHRYVIELEAAE